MATSGAVYVRIWELQVRTGQEAEFERVYGPEGDWVQLFRKSKAFLRTEFLRDLETDGRYFAVDYFSSQSGFQSFLKQHREEYDALDRRGETLCASEQRLGSFTVVSTPPSGI